MNRRLPIAWSLVLLALATAVAGQEAVSSEEASSAAGAPEFEIERFSWVGSVATGRGVTVINRFGTIRARFGGYEGQVEVFANVQHFAQEGPRLAVEIEESQTGVAVTVGYQDAETSELITDRENEYKKRADMVVYVPKGAPFSALTDRDLIDARGLESDVRARTVSGEITARKIKGGLDFASGTGNVQALLEAWGSERRFAFASERGDVSIYFGGEINARVRVATSGRISTDFSLDVDYQQDRQPIKQGETLVGKDLSVVTITSHDGHIRLIRKPLARKARVRPTGR